MTDELDAIEKILTAAMPAVTEWLAEGMRLAFAFHGTPKEALGEEAFAIEYLPSVLTLRLTQLHLEIGISEDRLSFFHLWPNHELSINPVQLFVFWDGHAPFIPSSWVFEFEDHGTAYKKLTELREEAGMDHLQALVAADEYMAAIEDWVLRGEQFASYSYAYEILAAVFYLVTVEPDKRRSLCRADCF